MLITAARDHMHDAGTTLTPLGVTSLNVRKHALLAEVKQAKYAFWVE